MQNNIFSVVVFRSGFPCTDVGTKKPNYLVQHALIRRGLDEKKKVTANTRSPFDVPVVCVS